MTIEIPSNFKILTNTPIDTRNILSSLSNLDTEYPIAVRGYGIITYINDIGKYYCFRGGLTAQYFVPLLNNGIFNIQYQKTILTNTDGYIFMHNLGNGIKIINLIVRDASDNDLVLCDYELLTTQIKLYIYTNIIVNIDLYFSYE